MKLNVLINLFVLHEYLPERRCTRACAQFLANYSSVVIEVDVFSRCRKVGGCLTRHWELGWGDVYVGAFAVVKHSG